MHRLLQDEYLTAYPHLLMYHISFSFANTEERLKVLNITKEIKNFYHQDFNKTEPEFYFKVRDVSMKILLFLLASGVSPSVLLEARFAVLCTVYSHFDKIPHETLFVFGGI